MRNGRRWYLAAVVPMTLVHPMLPLDIRAYTYMLSAFLTIPPIIALLRRSPPGARMPWGLLLVAMGILSVGNALVAFHGPLLARELCVTVAHCILLAAATALVLRRGRDDIGGLLDVSVAAIGIGGLLWTALLAPRLNDLGTPTSGQISMLVSLLVLGGVLGALLRLWLRDRRLGALFHLLMSLVTALVCNLVMAWTVGTMTPGANGVIELLYMISYAFVGLAVLDRSVSRLNEAGPAPVDNLSGARLAFLGLVLVADPVAGGMREMFGIGADGPLLAIGTLLVTPLVMIRVGRLARQRARAEEDLRHQATHDLLTGLPNRAELLDRLAGALRREQAAGEPSVVLLFCDLNGFKQVNDRLGHVVGDQLLIEVGERIGSGLRAGDTLARYGGDEFLLLCEDSDQQAAVARLTAHVEGALATPFRLSGEEVTIGSSVGSMISTGDLGADELISYADQAMYQVKESGRARRSLGVA